VLDRDGQLLAGLAAGEERDAGALDAERDVLADERERLVRAQRPRKQAGLAEHLEAVADPQHGAAVGREIRDRLHRRRKPGNRPRAQIVAVREAAGQDDRAYLRQLAVGVPVQDGIGSEVLERQRGVPVVVRPREDDDGDSRARFGHAPSASSIS